MAILRELETRKLSRYQPYPKQAEFHALGKTKRERALLAGNQLGKTLAGGAEVAMHLTGEYPDWWKGRRFDHPVGWWVGAESNETVRDTPQRMLMGQIGEWGTGFIAKRYISEIKRARGLADLIDIVKVKHRTGGESWVRFKAYEQGVDKWRSATLDGAWLDEEPPKEIYAEALTRTQHGDKGKGGMVFLTLTPLKGMSDVVRQFYPEPDTADRALIQMTIEEVDHYTDEQKAAYVAGYPPHEREARSKGIPTLGSGRVFPVAQSMVECEPFTIPDHWYQLVGMDFGWDHPTAAVHCAVDRDSKTFYVVNAYKQAEQVPAIHASAVKPWGVWMPVAWPHDGLQHDKSSGDQLAMSYRAQGLNMMIEHATHPSGGFGTEAAVQEMLEAMLTGHFKVFGHLSQWWDEFNTYHRKDGQIVKKYDDLMSATRMAWMMQRYARQKTRMKVPAFTNSYDPFDDSQREEWVM